MAAFLFERKLLKQINVFALIAMLAALSIYACASNAKTPRAVELNEWRNRNGTVEETAYSPLRLINKQNIQRLGFFWSIDLPGEHTLQATPLAVGHVLYFTGSYGNVYAVDARTGTLIWNYDPQVWKVNPAKMHFSLPVNRGVAYSEGRIFSATLDGRLLALDAKTGRLLWSVLTLAFDSMQTINGAPRAFKDKVIIGNGGSDFGQRGYVTAYDAGSGREVWRFYTAPGTLQQIAGDPAQERAAATWAQKYWERGTGATVWDSLTFDQDLNQIYLGTGNGPYDPNEPNAVLNDHLFVASIVALDADTGKYQWHYQTTPRDAWDFDATQQMTLAEMTIRGKRRKVLMQAPKNGFFYVLDRHDGKLISAQKTGKVTWAERIDLVTGRPVESVAAHYGVGESNIWPGPLGSHSVQSMSYSPLTRLVYLPYMKLGVRYSRSTIDADGISLGDLQVSSIDGDPARAKGALLAWDPLLQRARWTVLLDTIWNGGTLATGGSLVFMGTADGKLSVFDDATGRRLWQFDAKLGINAAPMSYVVEGKQYVSLLVGYGGSSAVWGMSMGWKYNAQPRRLLTFALDGKAELPATPGADFIVHAVDDPALKLDDTDVLSGHALFMQCAICHGLNLKSTGSPGPDLRESQLALTIGSLSTLLLEGTLLAHGMPRFESLTSEQIRQIHAYIRAGARKSLKSTDANQSVASGNHGL